MAMSVGAMIPVEEYLRTSYSPDREYRDGVLVQRNVGEWVHAELQAALAAYFRRRRKEWNIAVCTELRIKVRERWYPIPDVCVYQQPAPQERFPSRPPLLWIEILSERDQMMEMWSKARDVIAFGTSYVWIIDPTTLQSEVFTSSGGPHEVLDKKLRIPNTAIIVPLAEVMEE